MSKKTQTEYWILENERLTEIEEFYEFFYDGEVIVRSGVVNIPVSEDTRPWVSRLLKIGYKWVGEAPEDF